VTGAEAARDFIEKGWQIRYRGGNALCSTPSDLDLTVADAPGDPPGDSPRYSIAAWPSAVGEPAGPGGKGMFDLYDAERGVSARVRRVPTPERAAELLGRYGVAEPGAGGTHGQGAPMVPEGAEGPGAGSTQR
jgi:hypothetical protein